MNWIVIFITCIEIESEVLYNHIRLEQRLPSSDLNAGVHIYVTHAFIVHELEHNPVQIQLINFELHTVHDKEVCKNWSNNRQFTARRNHNTSVNILNLTLMLLVSIRIILTHKYRWLNAYHQGFKVSKALGLSPTPNTNKIHYMIRVSFNCHDTHANSKI